MKARCILCEQIDILDDNSIEAKKLKNHPISTYMCTNCSAKITIQTQKRMSNKQYMVYKGDTQTNILQF